MAKAPANLRSLARSHTTMALQIICGLAQHAESEAVRLSACALILDRGWGRALQPHTGEDGENVIQITIRNLIDEKRMLTIDHDTGKVTSE